jgi:signal transduction histidine kinase
MEILSLNRQMREWFPEIEPSVKPICYKAFNRPPRDAPCGYCPTRLTLQDGQNHESVTETPAEDRTINFRIISSAIRDEKGEVVAAIEMVEDVTARKQAQERLKRYAVDLARANEEVKQFAYIVSHDCRAPLVNIKGFIGEIRISLAAAQRALAPALPHLSEGQAQAATKALETDLPEALQFMDAAATAMDRLIEALLKLSRLERQELHPERLRVAEVVENALKGLAHQISERGATVRVGELPEVIADRTAMEQIMGNLLANAVLYLDPSRPGRIEVGGSRSGEETTFFVRDNGRGISPEDIPKLFAPFRRAGKQDVKGEGMGLAYVRTLVRRHEGEIRCESQLGVGTTFTFTLRSSIKKGEHDAHDAAEGV